MNTNDSQAPSEQLKIVIVGHVDHGKSTFVGRLFNDTGSLPEGKLEQLQKIAERRGVPFEWANLMDGLQAERDQIQRASVSIMSNIAEGFERSGNKEFSHFLYMAKGSAGEVRSHLYIAQDLGYLDEAEFKKLYELALCVVRQLSGFIKYLNGLPPGKDRQVKKA